MPSTRNIEIDFDVHKIIEIERRDFAESPNTVLRRLLKIDSANNKHKANTIGKSWHGRGVELPHGTELRMEYNGKTYKGMINDGIWTVEGKQFYSPSDAACGVAITKKGSQTSLNGWINWYIKRPSDIEWIILNSLRSKPKP